MSCKTIQDLIITDYLDKETNAAVQKEIQAHLNTCAGCRAFEKSVRERVSQPLRSIGQVKPPEEVWQRIKQSIAEEQARNAPGFLERLLEYLRNNFLVRRPAFALSTVTLMVLVTVLLLHSPFRKEMLVEDYLRDKSQYIQSLQNSVNGEVKKDYSFGTTIEYYFF